jgi:hypothetical protein
MYSHTNTYTNATAITSVVHYTLQRWWGPETSSSPLLCSTLASLLNDMPETMPVLLLATIEGEGSDWYNSAPPALRRALQGAPQYSNVQHSSSSYSNSSSSGDLYATAAAAAAAAVSDYSASPAAAAAVAEKQCGVVQLLPPDAQCRKAFIADLIKHLTQVLRGGLANAAATAASATASTATGGTTGATARKKRRRREVLQLAPKATPKSLAESCGPISAEALEDEEHKIRELRLYMRMSLEELGKNRQIRSFFWNPVEVEDCPDYYDIIAEVSVTSSCSYTYCY